ncbi:MAG: adenylyl-sulfate kinase [Thermodesulfobacteriota bacterium]
MIDTSRKSPDVVRQRTAVSRPRRETLNGHMSTNLWFTGLSGSGKSTLAHAVEERLHLMGCRTYVFDGDNVRHGLCGDLSFSPEDRRENLRRISEMVKLFLDAGVLSLTAFISPLRSDREMVKEIIGVDNVIEVYCNCPLEICEQRDVKGLYKKARAGEIENYTGISSPYEEPRNPDIVIDTGVRPLRDCVNEIITELRERGVIIR